MFMGGFLLISIPQDYSWVDFRGVVVHFWLGLIYQVYLRTNLRVLLLFQVALGNPHISIGMSWKRGLELYGWMIWELVTCSCIVCFFDTSHTRFQMIPLNVIVGCTWETLLKIWQNPGHDLLVICGQIYLQQSTIEQELFLERYTFSPENSTTLFQNPRVCYDSPIGVCQKFHKASLLLSNSMRFSGLYGPSDKTYIHCRLPLLTELFPVQGSPLSWKHLMSSHDSIPKHGT